jgi:hypothetical protein
MISCRFSEGNSKSIGFLASYLKSKPADSRSWSQLEEIWYHALQHCASDESAAQNAVG